MAKDLVCKSDLIVAPDAVAGQSELFQAVGVFEAAEEFLRLFASEEAEVGDHLPLDRRDSVPSHNAAGQRSVLSGEQRSQVDVLWQHGSRPHLPLLPLWVDQHDQTLSPRSCHRHHLCTKHICSCHGVATMSAI